MIITSLKRRYATRVWPKKLTRDLHDAWAARYVIRSPTEIEVAPTEGIGIMAPSQLQGYCDASQRSNYTLMVLRLLGTVSNLHA